MSPFFVELSFSLFGPLIPLFYSWLCLYFLTYSKHPFYVLSYYRYVCLKRWCSSDIIQFYLFYLYYFVVIQLSFVNNLLKHHREKFATTWWQIADWWSATPHQCLYQLLLLFPIINYTDFSFSTAVFKFWVPIIHTQL